MRFLPSFARLTLAAAAVVAPTLASAPAAEGALLPVAPRHVSRLMCEPTTLPRTERVRLRKLANPARTVLRDIAASLQRGGTASLDEGVAAIQTDAPAVPLDTGWRAEPLQPLDLLSGADAARPRLRTLARRSPRGPPFL